MIVRCHTKRANNALTIKECEIENATWWRIPRITPAFTVFLQATHNECNLVRVLDGRQPIRRARPSAHDEPVGLAIRCKIETLFRTLPNRVAAPHANQQHAHAHDPAMP